jgi:hypothetical protein
MSRWSDGRELHPHFEIGVLGSYSWTTAAVFLSFAETGGLDPQTKGSHPLATGLVPTDDSVSNVRLGAIGETRTHTLSRSPSF